MAEYGRHLFNPALGGLTAPPSDKLIKRAEKLKISNERAAKLGGYFLHIVEERHHESGALRRALLPLGLAEIALEIPLFVAVGVQSSIRIGRFSSQLVKEYPHVEGYNPAEGMQLFGVGVSGGPNIYVDAVLQYAGSSSGANETGALPPGTSPALLEAPINPERRTPDQIPRLDIMGMTP